MWYFIVSIPDLCRLSYFALASHRYGSTHCVEVVDVLEKKKLNCKNYHFQELCFSKVSNVRSISESFGEPHVSLILTNQCLTIMVRDWTVIKEPVHEISNNVVCATSKASDQPAHTRSLIRAFASSLSCLLLLSY